MRLTKKQDDHQDYVLPEGKTAFPVHPGQAPFRAWERYLDIDTPDDGRGLVREIKSHAVKKLELLDRLHKNLVKEAHSIVEKAREDLMLHNIRMYSQKIRNKVYYLYIQPDNEKFFSILEPAEFKRADPDSRYLGAYRLNEDSSWTRID